MKRKLIFIGGGLLIGALLLLSVQALLLYRVSHNLLAGSKAYLQAWEQQQTVAPQLISQLRQDLERLHNYLALLVWHKLDPLRDASQAALLLSQGQHRYLVMLQNSDELRATGGFFGSYAILSIDQGLLQPPAVGDIYEPDGQFTGFIEAPTGAKEYLSEGRGLRLPDSNWWPDFPTSAEQVLSFFSTIRQTDYDGVIAINLHLIEDLLDLSGPIYLPDYRTEVDARNFAALARADRGDFFAGSQEKINFLNHFFNHFKLRLSQLFSDNPRRFLPFLVEAVKNKNLQAYSRNKTLQQLIDKYQLGGRLHNPTQGRYFFLVESNVGINKANRAVSRQVQLDLEPDSSHLIIEWHNAFDAPYINYQRLYLHPDSQVVAVRSGTSAVAWQSQLIETAAGEQFLELAFLHSVLSGQSSQVQIEISDPIDLGRRPIYLQKQAGLRQVPYIIRSGEHSQAFELSHDQSVLE